MSESESKLEPKPARYPKELSPEYHKAHKQLMLWAAILFVWEFVGIDLDKAKDAEGYAGALIKSIKSPQAVPWVLLALVVYFLFKCTTEWAQCQIERRKLRFARADFVSAWIVSLAAIGLYIGQAASRYQFADVLQNSNRSKSAVLGVLAGAMLAMVVAVIVTKVLTGVEMPSDIITITIILSLASLAMSGVGIIVYKSPTFTLLGELPAGSLVGLSLWLIVRKSRHTDLKTLQGIETSSLPKK